MDGKKKVKAEKAGFEQNMRELTEIVAALEKSDVTLDNAIELFESGILRTKSAMETVRAGRGKVTKLKAELDSLLETPFLEDGDAE